MITFWDRMRANFVFLPLVIVGLCMAMGVLVPLIEVPESYFLSFAEITPNSAQDLLGSVATAMVTMVSLVFSITIVTLSLAASHLGPRLLRTFMSMRSIRIGLGLFIGTGIYALLVLITVRSQEGAEFVPHLAVLLSVALTVLSLIYLVYFTHRIAWLIQAPNTAQAVGHDLDQAIRRLYPERFGVSAGTVSDEDVQAKLDSFGDNYRVVTAREEGYIEGIDIEGLMSLAVKHDLILQLYCRPGQFMLLETPLVKVWPFERPGVNLPRRINYAFVMGNRPTPRQDVECSINELVEVALRALSPSLNDPYTAINCIDRLAASLSRLAQREIPSPYRLDKKHNLRIITKGATFTGALNQACDQIRQCSEKLVGVQTHQLESLAVIAKFTNRVEDRTAIQRQADMIKAAAERNTVEPYDLQELRERYAQVQEALYKASHGQRAQEPLRHEEELLV